MTVDGARRAGGAYITRRVGAGVQRGGRPLPKSRKRIEALCPAATARDMCANEKERGHRSARAIDSHDDDDGGRWTVVRRVYYIVVIHIYICIHCVVHTCDRNRLSARASENVSHEDAYSSTSSARL